MPAYLIALAVGRLEYRSIGPRSRIWAEPPIVEAAAWEFAETDKFLTAGIWLPAVYLPFKFVALSVCCGDQLYALSRLLQREHLHYEITK